MCLKKYSSQYIYIFYSDSIAASRAGSLQINLGRTNLSVCFVAQALDTIAPVQSHADLLVSRHEPLQFGIEFDILTGENVAVMLQSIYFRSIISILAAQISVLAPQIVLLTPSRRQAILSSSAFGLDVVKVGGVVAVAGQLTLRPTDELGFLTHLEVQSSGILTLLVRVPRQLVPLSHQIRGSCLIGLSGPAKLELPGVCLLGKISSPFLRLIQVIVSGLDSAILVTVLPGFEGVEVLRPFDLLLVFRPLVLQLGKLVRCVIVFFPQSMSAVTFLGDIPLSRENFSLTSADLLTSRGNLRLQVVIRTILLIEQEASVIDFLLEPSHRHKVGVSSGLEVIVLQQFLVLQVPVLGLDGVELVAQGHVVLVSLLDLENLRLQLRNQQVLLIGRQMHTIVILQANITVRVSKSANNLLVKFFISPRSVSLCGVLRKGERGT